MRLHSCGNYIDNNYIVYHLAKIEVRYRAAVTKSKTLVLNT